MTNNYKSSFSFRDKLLTSFFGAGLAPVAPGTFGSIAAMPFIYAIFSFANTPTKVSITILLSLLIGFYLQYLNSKYELKDLGSIVIDEVAGMFVTALFLPQISLTSILAAFLAFRFFDILKPWPVSYFDRRHMNGWGILLDDIVAGLLGGLVLTGIYYFF